MEIHPARSVTMLNIMEGKPADAKGRVDENSFRYLGPELHTLAQKQFGMFNIVSYITFNIENKREWWWEKARFSQFLINYLGYISFCYNTPLAAPKGIQIEGKLMLNRDIKESRMDRKWYVKSTTNAIPLPPILTPISLSPLRSVPFVDRKFLVSRHFVLKNFPLSALHNYKVLEMSDDGDVLPSNVLQFVPPPPLGTRFSPPPPSHSPYFPSLVIITSSIFPL